ncbi:MAG: hypothetical protein AAF449_24560 [Myxococcota bacterium]
MQQNRFRARSRTSRAFSQSHRHFQDWRKKSSLLALLLCLMSCRESSGTPPPPDGWANAAPTVVERVVDRPASQVLKVRQDKLTTWIKVPHVGAKIGDYILLGRGRARNDVSIPEIDLRVPHIIDIKYARVVNFETAKRVVLSAAPKNAVAIGTVYDEIDQRKDKKIVVYGTVVKAASAVGWNWVHLRDGTGDSSADTHDLTVKTTWEVAEGQRVAFEGTLRKDVDLGFGYHYDALVEDGEVVES